MFGFESRVNQVQVEDIAQVLPDANSFSLIFFLSLPHTKHVISTLHEVYLQ